MDNFYPEVAKNITFFKCNKKIICITQKDSRQSGYTLNCNNPGIYLFCNVQMAITRDKSKNCQFKHSHSKSQEMKDDTRQSTIILFMGTVTDLLPPLLD